MSTRTRRTTVVGEPQRVEKEVKKNEIDKMVKDMKKKVVAAHGRGGEVMIANHHTADFLFPRVSPSGLSIPPMSLPAQMATPVDREIWKEIKKMPVVQHWIDRGLLAEVRSAGQVQLLDDTSTDLEVPEHLQEDEIEAETGGIQISAKANRTGLGTVTI